MQKCVFCDMDDKKIENTVLEETKYFYILPSLGSLVDGYVLIVTKRHVNSMSELTDEEMTEYVSIVERYRVIFQNIYGIYPILFEHGTPVVDDNKKASSVIHAHTHIVNHMFLNREEILLKLNFMGIDRLDSISNEMNYIMYIDNDNVKYVSYDFEGVSQLMRILIARDLGFEDSFDWKKEKFMDNINKTISKVRRKVDS